MTKELDQSYFEARVKIGELLKLGEGFEMTANADQFIEERITLLANDSQTTSVINFATSPLDVFISPESEVRAVAVGHGFKIDDPTAYQHFLRSFGMFASQWHDLAEPGLYDEVAIYGAQYGQGYYLDAPEIPADALARRTDLMVYGLGKEALSIGDFKGIAYCTERAALAHNMLHFAGVETIFLTGVSLGRKAGKELHCFLLTNNPEGDLEIYDPTNPLTFRKTPAGPVAFFVPAIYAGGDEILKDQSVDVGPPLDFKFVDLKDRLKDFHQDKPELLTLKTLQADSPK